MAGNSFGTLFRITTFGESHGAGIGLVIDGCPSNIAMDEKLLVAELQRRKPGQSSIVTQRKEEDSFEILSGVFKGRTTGAPIAFLIRNSDAHSEDYDALEKIFRPSHADYTYAMKYGHRDHRGGGRSSARETVSRVIAGSVAKMILRHVIQSKVFQIRAFVSRVGDVILETPYPQLNLNATEKSLVRCPDKKVSERMIQRIEEARKNGDSLGGTITCVCSGIPLGLGEPVFDKLSADLAKAMLSIPAVKGFGLGSGFAASGMKGSEHNDLFIRSKEKSNVDKKEKIGTVTNFSGGIQGGISNGEDIYFEVAFKPTSTLMRDQNTISSSGKKVVLKGKGRHDPCVLPRAVPIVEAMSAVVLVDHFLRSGLRKNIDF